MRSPYGTRRPKKELKFETDQSWAVAQGLKGTTVAVLIKDKQGQAFTNGKIEELLNGQLVKQEDSRPDLGARA